MRAAWASGAASLAGYALGGLGSILMLHHVRPSPSSPLGVNAHLTVTPDFLDQIISALKQDGIDLISMDELVERLSTGRTSARRFATFTLDDGYRDNLQHAWPVFKKHDVPFTIYIAPGLIDGSAILWWEILEQVVSAALSMTVPGHGIMRCASIEEKQHVYGLLLAYLTSEVAEQDQFSVVRSMAERHGVDWAAFGPENLLNWAEIRQLASEPLCTIGSHGINHYALKRLPEIKAVEELRGAVDLIEFHTGKRPAHLAYPYGYETAVGERDVELASRVGLSSAVTTRHGTIQRAHRNHIHALPRISLNGRFQDITYPRVMMTGFTTLLANRGRRVVTV
ncbi:MAG: polysaccharide deacetylase family protein [Phyllobacterium sp.]